MTNTFIFFLVVILCHLQNHAYVSTKAWAQLINFILFVISKFDQPYHPRYNTTTLIQLDDLYCNNQ